MGRPQATHSGGVAPRWLNCLSPLAPGDAYCLTVRQRPVPQIEMIFEESTPDGLAPGGAASGSWYLAVVLVAVVGGTLLLRSLGTPVERPEAAPSPPAPTTRADPAPSNDSLPTTPTDSAPRSHPAFLARIPGSGQEVLPDVEGLSLLYVSSRGHPTLIDLDTGDRSELYVSDDWNRYVFMVERGRVVTGDPGSEPTRDPAGDRAFAVVAYRTVSGGSGARGLDATPSMRLTPVCGEMGCSFPPTGLPISYGGDSIRPFDEVADPRVASIFDPGIWTRDGSWMLAPAESGLDLRFPVPADHSPIWLIHQPARG